MRDALLWYFRHGLPPGSGTMALLTNSLDGQNDPRLHRLLREPQNAKILELAVQMISELPFFMRGEYVQDWMKQAGEEGLTQDQQAFILISGFNMEEWVERFPIM